MGCAVELLHIVPGGKIGMLVFENMGQFKESVHMKLDIIIGIGDTSK